MDGGQLSRALPRSSCSCSRAWHGRQGSATRSIASWPSWCLEMARIPISTDLLRHAVLAGGATGVASLSGGSIECRLPSWEIPALADRLATVGVRCQFVGAADTRAGGADFTL